MPHTRAHTNRPAPHARVRPQPAARHHSLLRALLEQELLKQVKQQKSGQAAAQDDTPTEEITPEPGCVSACRAGSSAPWQREWLLSLST